MNTEVEDIKARLSVTEVVGGYVQLTKAGVNWKGLCPFHGEKTPSFVVSEERGSWHCFGCNKGGDIFTFLMEIESLSFPEALSILAERAGVELKRRSPEKFADGAASGFPSGESRGDAGMSKRRLLEVIDLASRFFEKQLWDGVGRKAALPYLIDRGLSEESIRQFRLGFSLPGWRNLSDFLRSRGFSDREMEAAGLSIVKRGDSKHEVRSTKYGERPVTINNQRGTNDKQQTRGNSEQVSYFTLSTTHASLPTTNHQLPTHSYDRFRERIMFPIMDALGRVIGFSARVLPGADDPPAGGTAKYINTPETPLYHKSKALYGFSLAKRAVREAGEAIFVEGNMDVIAMHQAGFQNTVAVSGTALTEEQLRIIHRFTDRISLFFDMDGAGQKAARKSAEAALAFGFAVSLVALPAGKDAAEAARSDIELLRSALLRKTSAPEYFLAAAVREGNSGTPEGRRHIAEDFLRLVALVPHEMDRVHWIARLSSALGVEESVLSQMLQQVSLREFRSQGERRDLSREGNNRAAENGSSFEKRSDVLGESVLSLLFAVPEALSKESLVLSKRVRNFFEHHPFAPCFSLDDMRFHPDRVPALLEREASRLAFLGESMLEPAVLENSDKVAIAVHLVQQTLQQLDAVLRRETMQSIEHEMRSARECGDRERERELMKQLVELSGENRVT